jgi:uncharacterized membrane protein YuzA (DUF378 family)
MLGCLFLGVVGIFNFNLAGLITGGSIILQRILYTLVFLGFIDIIILLLRTSFLFNKK